MTAISRQKKSALDLWNSQERGRGAARQGSRIHKTQYSVILTLSRSLRQAFPALLGLGGWIFLLGTVGALENDAITLHQAIRQGVPALLAMAAAVIHTNIRKG